MRTLLKAGAAALILVGLGACAQPAAPAATPKSEIKTVAPAVATAAPAAAAPIATGPSLTAVAAVKRGGVLVISRSNQPSSMDPIYDTNANHLNQMAIFEALLRYQLVDEKTGKNELKPWLAESWDMPDPNTVVLKLRKGVKFHDGSDFNAEAAKWSLERMGKAEKSLSKTFAANFASLEVLDPYTLKIAYKQASAIALLNLTVATGGTGSIGPAIVSKAYIDKVGEEAFRTSPSATGPMKVKEWKRDDVFVMVPFEGYWKDGVDGKKLPYLDGINYRRISDSAVALLELRSGTVHLSENVLPTDYASVKSNPDLVLKPMPWAGSRWYFGYNQKRSPYGTDVRLRQAANYAIDREAMAQVMTMGAGAPLYYVTWASGMVGYDDRLPKYEFNPTKAQQLVKEMGIPDSTEIEYIHTSSTDHRKVAELVQGMWLKVGIKAKLLAMDAVAAREKFKLGEFELNGGGVTYSPDPVFFNRKYLCTGSANWSNYCNPELDKCLIEGERTVDLNKRTEIYGRCQKIIYEDALLNGLFLDGFAIVTRKEVKGLKTQAMSPDVDEVWLDK